jgi:hypothetical protein
MPEFTEDDLDDLVDDATHAVANLIPLGAWRRLGRDRQSSILAQINDSLSPILAEVTAPQTRKEAIH